MEVRDTELENLRANNPEKLTVFHARSYSDEIRFYTNNTEYVSAVESDYGCLIKFGEENKEKESSLTSKKENTKVEKIKLYFSGFVITILAIDIMLYLSIIIDNVLIYIFVTSIVYIIALGLQSMVSILNLTSNRLRSKHSAEHMMVNFLKINQRLPKNMEEIKKCSRFSSECGTRYLGGWIAEILAICLIMLIIAVIIYGIAFNLCDNLAVNLIVTIVILYFIAEKLIKKTIKIDFIINPVKKVLNNIIQLATTTSKVRDKDIIMAYYVSREWIQLVYPEFYNKEEDVFWKECLEVNIKKE